MYSTEVAFGIKVFAGLMIGSWFMVWTAFQHQPLRLGAWADVYLGTILGGILGARIVYILLNLDPFIKVPLNVPRLWFAELSWQGAIIGGLLAMWGMCRWRKIDISSFADGLALAFPVGMMGVCWASRSAGIILGAEVGDPTDYPVWRVAFLPDFFRDVVPRYELQWLGVALGGLILLIVGGLIVGGWLEKSRLWVTLALTGLAVFVLDRYSALDSPKVIGLHLDRWSAGLLIAFGVGMFVWQWWEKRSLHTASDTL
jgi:phosphatidylglycerol:prolipoprotein diacylglycerol transferase